MALARSTFTRLWMLHDVHQMDIWWTSGRNLYVLVLSAHPCLVPSELRWYQDDIKFYIQIHCDEVVIVIFHPLNCIGFPQTDLLTVIDAPVARRTVILVMGISRSTNLILRPSYDWRRTKLFDASQSTRARSDKSFVTSNLNVMSDTSSPGAETRIDCVSFAIFVKKKWQILWSLLEVGRSAPNDPVRFFMIRFDVVVSQQRWTYAHCLYLQMVDRFTQYYLVLGQGHYTRKRSILTSDSDWSSAIAIFF